MSLAHSPLFVLVGVLAGGKENGKVDLRLGKRLAFHEIMPGEEGFDLIPVPL